MSPPSETEKPMTQEEVAARPPTDSEERRALKELLRLYDWRFELAKREKDPRNSIVSTNVDFYEETRRMLRQYGAEKKAAWEVARRVLAALGEARGTASASESPDARLREENTRLERERSDLERRLTEAIQSESMFTKAAMAAEQRNTPLVARVAALESALRGLVGIRDQIIVAHDVDERWNCAQDCRRCAAVGAANLLLEKPSVEVPAVTGTTSGKPSIPHPGSPDGT